jgi:sugar lactone lactonase YvrE
MMSLLHSIVIGGAVVLTTASAVPLMAPTVVRANPATPDKLWDGFSSPVGMAFDAAGHLYVAEWGAGRVLRIAPDGTRAVFADGLAGPSGLAIGPDGAIYVASYSRDESIDSPPRARAVCM